MIDSEQQETPFRSKGKSKNSLVFPDHYAIVVTFKYIPTIRDTVKNCVRSTVWNLNKKGGWEIYFKETNKNKALNSILSIVNNDSNVINSKNDRELTNVKFKAFG